jgi:hypothetical protein
MIRFIIIAIKPKVTIRSLKKGIFTTLSPDTSTGFLISSHRKKTNNANAMLQTNVNRDKNNIIFTVFYFFTYLSNISKQILLSSKKPV